MAGNEIVVKFAALHTASDDIASALRTMHTELSELETRIAPMVNTWEGGAQAAYLVRQKEWHAASQDIATLLTQIRGGVDKAAAIMLAREKANTAKFE
jgi:early secretory antigenic target protein ESAT-6